MKLTIQHRLDRDGEVFWDSNGQFVDPASVTETPAPTDEKWYYGSFDNKAAFNALVGMGKAFICNEGKRYRIVPESAVLLSEASYDEIEDEMTKRSRK